MQYILAKRKLITAILMQAAMLYGLIFIANWFSIKACSTAYMPPTIHCQWDLAAMVGGLFHP